MTTTQPTIVIVPGAWHPPAVYEKFLSQLQGAGFEASIVGLPSCDSDKPETASCLLDTEAVRKHIVPLIDTGGKDIVIFCHSYGGIPAGGAAVGLSKDARIKEGKEGGVIGLVYVAAFVVAQSSSLLSFMSGKHAPYVKKDQPTEYQCIVDDAKDVFFHDVNQDEAERLIRLLRPQSLHAFDSKTPPPAWAESAYSGRLAFLRCMQDQALPPYVQDAFVQKSSVAWRMKDIEASHSPFASKPDKVIEALKQWVQEFSQ